MFVLGPQKSNYQSYSQWCSVIHMALFIKPGPSALQTNIKKKF